MKSKFSIFVLILSICLFACQEAPKNEGQHSMRLQDSPSLDSLTRLIFTEIVNHVSSDTIFNHLQLLRQQKGQMIDLRTDYYKGLLYRSLNLNDSSLTLLQNVKSNLDSVKAPYFYARVKHELAILSDNYLENYITLNDNLQYFKDQRDTIMIYSTLNVLGYLMHQLQDFDKAYDYLSQVKNLAKEQNSEFLQHQADMNLAIILCQKNDTAQALALYEDLLNYPKLISNPRRRELVMRNMYHFTNDRHYLEKAREISENVGDVSLLKPLHYALLSELYLKDGHTDSAIIYGHKAMDHYNNSLESDYKLFVLSQIAKVLKEEGKMTEAFNYLDRYVQMKDSLEKSHHEQRIQNFETNQRIALYETQVRNEKAQERLRWIIVLLIVLLAASVTLYYFRRRSQRSQIEKLQAELNLEQINRSLAARSLAMEEQDSLLAETRRRLSTISKDNKDNVEIAEELDNLIKVHNSSRGEWENFETLFEKVNPNFTPELRKRYPDMPESQIKLATYILVGLSNQQISQMLQIRNESVRQARWRLRKKLEISDPNMSIEEFLSKI